MQLKNHISLFLALLMLTRMFAFDGQLLQLVTEPGELVVVKHSCKLKNYAFSEEAVRLGEDSSGVQLEYPSFCNSFFQFEVAEAFEVFSITPFHEFSSPVLTLHSAEQQNTSPPPKAAV